MPPPANDRSFVTWRQSMAASCGKFSRSANWSRARSIKSRRSAAARVATALLRAAHSIRPRCFPGARPAERACARWAWISAPASAACPSSTAVCGRRAPMWSGCTNRCCTPSINWNKPCACLRLLPLAGHVPPAGAPRGRVVEIRYRQSQQDAELFAQALLALPVESWWEDWMRHADRLLDYPELVNIVHQVLLKRRPKSRTRGRLSTPAEVVLRLMVLKHVRNWSYGVLAREVRANLVYRQFTRLGHHRMPHAKTLGKLGLLLGPTVVQQLHQRVVAQAQAEKVIRGNKLRVDTTVVETNIHYPTDSVLLGDGVRVLTRVMRQINEVVGDMGEKLRDRRRSVGHRLIEIGRASRGRGPQVQKKLEQGYRKLLGTTGQVVAQAKRFSQEIVKGVKRSADVLQQAALEGMKKEIDTMLPRVQQVVSQTRARIIHGVTNSAGKIVSLFEHTTEIIRKGKPGKPTEFGKMIKVQEAENQIIVAFQVYDKRPADSALLVPAIEQHQQRLGVVPRVAAGDAGFFSAANETAAQKLGVAQVAVPFFGTKSVPRRKRQKERWFRKAQKWRIGCEGRISVLKRRHGLRRCLYKGDAGMHRWVGLGVIADNLIYIGRVLTARLMPQKTTSDAP